MEARSSAEISKAAADLNQEPRVSSHLISQLAGLESTVMEMRLRGYGKSILPKAKTFDLLTRVNN